MMSKNISLYTEKKRNVYKTYANVPDSPGNAAVCRTTDTSRVRIVIESWGQEGTGQSGPAAAAAAAG